MRTGLTPSFPFKVDPDDSDYILVDKVNALVRQNLKNLVLTNPGERIMDPNFGVGIKRFLFENKTAVLKNNIKNLISGQVKKYMPFLSIQDVQFTDIEDQPNYLGISIYYVIVPNKISDTLLIQVRI